MVTRNLSVWASDPRRSRSNGIADQRAGSDLRIVTDVELAVRKHNRTDAYLHSAAEHNAGTSPR